MESKNKYIGDDKFKKFLEHYNCQMPLEVVKLRFAGAICSPNVNLRPADVISSLWPEHSQPRLETKKEAELFFKFFMGLWDDIFIKIQENNLNLAKIPTDSDLENVCKERYEQIELGFVEGFWGGLDKVDVPAFVAEVVDSLSRLAALYQTMAKTVNTEKKRKNVFDAIADCDKMCVKSISFIVEHYTLPHINELKSKAN